MKPLRSWSLARVVVTGAAWIIVLQLLMLARPVMLAIAARRAHPTEDVYILMPHVPGGGLVLLGPPLLLGAAWWWVRRSRQAALSKAIVESHRAPPHVEWIEQLPGRLSVEITPGADSRALRALGGRRSLVWWRMWTFATPDAASVGKVLGGLRDLGLPLLGAGPGWHPGGIFELYRERGHVTGQYLNFAYTGQGRWRIDPA